MTDGLRARVSGSDDGAHGLLVKALETAAALQRFQVAANRAFAHKLLKLRFSNQPAAQQFPGAFPAHRPSLAIGKRLLEKLEVRERRHSVKAQFLPLFLELRRAITSLPVSALASEDDVAGQVARDHSNNSIQRGVRAPVAIRVFRENARSRVPKLAGFQERFRLPGPGFGRHKTAI